MTKLPMSPPPDEPQENADDPPHPTAAIRDGLLASLGRPPELYRVVVVPLWRNHYRANVLVGTDPTAVRTAHSYFVTADAIGRILTIVPPLTRMYE